MKKRITPLDGQESVWDYPRPPRLESTSKRLKVVHQGITLAETTRGFRVLETSHPPVYYFPPEDIHRKFLRPNEGRTSFCEFKGMARYWDLVMDDAILPRIAWSYPQPNQRFTPIAHYLAFYASKVDSCWVDDEPVQQQAGDFYGGWITQNIVGPFKGGPGTWGW